MNLILIGNYSPDKQESMRRFADMLADTIGRYRCEIIRPPVVFGRFAVGTRFAKWFGYVDKWLIGIPYFGWIAFSRPRKTRFHICDHSNSPYLHVLPKRRTSITCHDVLAIRGAFGFVDAHCPASATGRILQRWILGNLQRCGKIAFVSDLTRRQFRELTGASREHRFETVIHNSLNADFCRMDEMTAAKVLSRFNLDGEFILTVGSSLERKNREMLIEMASALGPAFTGLICFAGQSVTESIERLAMEHGLFDRVVSVEKPTHEELLALYSSCRAFIFPSFSEGFGWPVVEAQACGAPVIASSVEPMPEVAGDGAMHADPNAPAAFADAYLKISDTEFRLALIERGYRNAARFGRREMTDAYLKLIAMETA